MQPETFYTSTVNLNNPDPQVVYTHEGPADFTPTRIMVTRHSGPMPAEGSAARLIFDDNGPALLRDEIYLSQLDESGAVVQKIVERSGKLSVGQQVRVRPDVAYGDDAFVSVTVFGV